MGKTTVISVEHVALPLLSVLQVSFFFRSNMGHEQAGDSHRVHPYRPLSHPDSYLSYLFPLSEVAPSQELQG